MLNQLVAKLGCKAWIRIAGEIRGRSDVQYRYHWLRMHAETERNLAEHNGAEDSAQKKPVCGEVDAKGPHPMSV
jgi:hypothetical protein